MIRPPWLAALADPSRLRAFTSQDWSEALFRWRRGRVLGWIASIVPAELIEPAPAPVRRQFESATCEAGFSRDRAVQSIALLERALRDRGCRAMLLKGAAHVRAGRRAGDGRTMDDLDLLVERDALEQVEAALRDGGWQERGSVVPEERALRLRYSHQLPEWLHRGGAMVIDLHVGVLGPPRRGDP
ncbi:MAG TPA: nucleotidyltransferase family protein, partial [Gemmatimonadales bacterium]|nr:nucleotidyltransferase family protein [Gemmatimonadales bacterium]